MDFIPLDRLVDLCLAPNGAWVGFSVPLLLLVAGLVGGVMHCAPMCGALVLGQVGDRLERVPVARLCELQRVRSALLLPYHLGRITTYAMLGALAAAAGGWLGDLPWLTHLRTVLLGLGALAFLAAAIAGLGLVPPWRAPRLPVLVHRVLMRLALAARPLGGFPLGLALGLIPCGMIYAALAVAGAGQDPLAGAVAMAAFGLGTAPALIGVGLAGHAAGRHFTPFASRAQPYLMLVSGVFLAALAFAGS
jgi:sulfite exporter TauE/SafE